jgi:predicted nucleic acid-binding protein
MILVDTSAWIEFDRASGHPAEQRLSRLIGGGGELAATDPVLMEVLAGARSDAAALSLRRLLTSFGWIPFDAVSDFDGAARIYRACRSSGVTPRGLVDCMIAAIALRTDTPLLTADRDFLAMADVIPLRLDDASTS